MLLDGAYGNNLFDTFCEMSLTSISANLFNLGSNVPFSPS